MEIKLDSLVAGPEDPGMGRDAAIAESVLLEDLNRRWRVGPMMRRTKGPEENPRVVMTVWVPKELHGWLRQRKWTKCVTIEEQVTEALGNYKARIEAGERTKPATKRGKRLVSRARGMVKRKR